MGNSKAALASYQEAVEVERKIGDKNGLTTNLMNLGLVLSGPWQIRRCPEYTNEALQIARDTARRKSHRRRCCRISASLTSIRASIRTP